METYFHIRGFTLASLIAVYLVILAGGIVRSSGSGMGCPDWPKCFDNWIPPKEVSELPANYHSIYIEKRNEKNKIFAKYLAILGFKEKAQHILNDKSILEEIEFNPYKAWIEYINRLIGMITGLIILGLFISSLVYWKKDRSLFIFCFSTLLLTIFQGWIGSVVVSTNLVPWMVTVHMLIALIIVILLIYILIKTDKKKITCHKIYYSKNFYIITFIVLSASLIQIISGTQVREHIDEIARSLNFSQRILWISNLSNIFDFHRSFSLFILILNIYWLYGIYKRNKSVKFLIRIISFLFVFIFLEISAGVTMAYFAIPPALQPLHLLMGVLIFSLQCYLFFVLNIYGLSFAIHIQK